MISRRALLLGAIAAPMLPAQPALASGGIVSAATVDHVVHTEYVITRAQSAQVREFLLSHSNHIAEALRQAARRGVD